MTIFALKRNGQIAIIAGVTASKSKPMIETLAEALQGNGLRWTPKIWGSNGWVRTDLAKSRMDDVVRVEAWGEPDADATGIAAKAGQIYCWAACELELQAEAYKAAGGKMDDYLITLATGEMPAGSYIV